MSSHRSAQIIVLPEKIAFSSYRRTRINVLLEKTSIVKPPQRSNHRFARENKRFQITTESKSEFYSRKQASEARKINGKARKSKQNLWKTNENRWVLSFEPSSGSFWSPPERAQRSSAGGERTDPWKIKPGRGVEIVAFSL